MFEVFTAILLFWQAKKSEHLKLAIFFFIYIFFIRIFFLYRLGDLNYINYYPDWCIYKLLLKVKVQAHSLLIFVVDFTRFGEHFLPLNSAWGTAYF